MKFLIVLACALAVASAGHIVAPLAYHAGAYSHYYAGAQHLPVIGANGVPVDTAEVQHAKAAHFAHKVEAHARNGDYAYAHYAHHAPVVAHHAVAAPVVSTYAAHHVAAPVVSTYAAHHVAAPVVAGAYAHPYAYHHAYPTTAVHPTSVNGVPLDTPEVAAAKINHFAAHAEALHRHRRGVVAYTAPAYSTYSAWGHHAPVVASSYAAHHGYVAHPYSYTPFARYFY